MANGAEGGTPRPRFLRGELPRVLAQPRSRLASRGAARQLVESLPSPREMSAGGEQVIERAGTAVPSTYGALAAVRLWLSDVPLAFLLALLAAPLKAAAMVAVSALWVHGRLCKP